MAAVMTPQQEKEYRTLLGVDANATEKEIRRAYHALAKENHTDKNPGAAEAFTDITIAYEQLTNKKPADDNPLHNAQSRAQSRNNRAPLSQFRRATAGMRPQEKLDYAVQNGYRDEIKNHLARGVEPLDDTIRDIIDRNACDIMKIFIDNGYKPAQSIVDRVADISRRTHDRSMLREMLRAPGVKESEPRTPNGHKHKWF